MVDSIAGAPAEVVPRFRELAALGIDGFVVAFTAPELERLLETLAQSVVPELA